MDIIILILATWRIANMLASPDETGPFDVLGRLRYLVGVRFDKGQPHGTNELASGLLCIWCNSVWIGLAWTTIYWLIPAYTTLLALPFALSGGAIIIGEILGWLEQTRQRS